MADLSFGQAIIVYFLSPLLLFLQIVVIVNVVLSLLINFNVVNPHNQLVAVLWRLSSGLVEPLLRPIRSVLPPLGGLDLSPLILLLIISFIRGWVLAQLFVALA